MPPASAIPTTGLVSLAPQRGSRSAASRLFFASGEDDWRVPRNHRRRAQTRGPLAQETGPGQTGPWFFARRLCLRADGGPSCGFSSGQGSHCGKTRALQKSVADDFGTGKRKSLTGADPKIATGCANETCDNQFSLKFFAIRADIWSPRFSAPGRLAAGPEPTGFAEPRITILWHTLSENL